MEQEKQQHQEIGVDRKKASAARKGKGKDTSRREKKIHPYQTFSTTTVNEFFMQKIADRFGDGWHKSIMDMFVVKRIAALYGDGWHK